jgi:drug/metabolite transporter (DMT)-like permease
MHIDNLSGIGFGLGAAACQSLSYIFSRRFVGRTGATPALLLIASHLIMGAGSLLLLPLLAPRHLPPLADFALPLAGAAAFYLVAQLGLFHVLRLVESSRVAPLLGLKVVVLACLAVLLMRQGLHPLQWAAVGLSALAAWLLNEAGGRVPARCLAVLGMSIGCYCLSDLSIGVLMQRLEGVEPSPAFTGAALTYILCALLTLPFAFRRELRQPRLWVLAAPFAVAWFGAMCLLYACFGAIGVVFGNIVQSTRGILSVVIGWGLARIGHTHLESHVGRRVIWRRATGALLMLAAVALYLLAR